MGSFFLVIHSLVSTLGYGYVPTQPCFLHFIYLVGTTFVINVRNSIRSSPQQIKLRFAGFIWRALCGLVPSFSLRQYLT